jgi:hypothetical protein
MDFPRETDSNSRSGDRASAMRQWLVDRSRGELTRCDAKPPAAARTRVVSGPYTGASGRDIVHQRPPARLRGGVSAAPLLVTAADAPKMAIPALTAPVAMHRSARSGCNHKVSLRRRVQRWESLGSGRVAVEPPYYRTPTLIDVKTGTSFVRGEKSESLKT